MDPSDENKICDLLENIINRQKQLERSFEELKHERTTPWMDIQETAQYLRISVRTIRRLVSTNNIPFKRSSGDQKSTLLFHRYEIDYWILNGNRRPNRREREQLDNLVTTLKGVK